MAKMSSPASLTVPRVGVSSPAMIDSKVLLPEPEAPTMAAVSFAPRVKAMSCRMSSVPAESVTDLKTWSTATISAGTCEDIERPCVLNRRDFILSAAAASASGLMPLGAFAQGAPKTVLVMGDSLSAEYGLKRGEGWVALLEKRLAEQKIAARVVNASISGETSAGGRA